MQTGNFLMPYCALNPSLFNVYIYVCECGDLIQYLGLLKFMASSLGLQCMTPILARKRCSTRLSSHHGACISLLSLDRKASRLGLINHNAIARRDNCWRIQSGDGDGIFGLQLPPPNSSPVEVIDKFYQSINHGDKESILELMTDDCCFEDLLFYVPFRRKEEIGHFLQGLMEAMGSTVKFKVENVTVGTGDIASVIWHLEWRGKKIPFTAGCNYFEFQRDKENIFIRKIRGLEELPVKPGDLILKLLMATRKLFDHYPAATESLLSSHDFHDIFFVMLHFAADQNDPSNRSKNT